ncbi:Probable metal-binding protein (DUF2387) [Moraxella atlantae]|nr:Probable metal-binding protein (DUF2387) [Moraxella atlantae]
MVGNMRYQSSQTKRQFLAGVACPKCGAIDKVVQVRIFSPDVDEYIECTACGHQERRPTREDLAALNQVVPTDGIGVGVVRFKT